MALFAVDLLERGWPFPKQRKKRLLHSVSPEQRKKFSFLNLKGDPIERPNRAESLGDLAEFDSGGAHV